MGSFDEGETSERPVHAVRLDSFYMGKYEVTTGQYCDYLNSVYDANQIKLGGTVYGSPDETNSYPYCYISTAGSIDLRRIVYSAGVFSVRTKGGRSMVNDPMVDVSWYGAAAYCNWRSEKEGLEECYNLSTWDCDFSKKGYRLPTEAEWEFAARGGLVGKRFIWGDTISHSRANYFSYWGMGEPPYYPYDLGPTSGHHPTWNDGLLPYTSPVGSFSANGYGLCDITGNAWEWCNDWYSRTYYSSSPTNNPVGPTGPLSHRVVRGGDWGAFVPRSHGWRVAFRSSFTPAEWHYCFGFRLVLDF